MRSKTVVILINVVLIGFIWGCFEGPQGPSGDSGTFYKSTGVLIEEDLTSGDYWDILIDWLEDDMLVQVWIRLNPDGMWKSPLWYHHPGCVRIYRTGEEPPYEYMIIGCSRQMSGNNFPGWRPILVNPDLFLHLNHLESHKRN